MREGAEMNRREVLRRALLRAGRVLTARFGKVTYRQKRPADLVTAADLESQKVILETIRRALPGDDYRAEEDAVRATGAEHEWVIDPLDGTTNYAHGYPASSVSIGVLRRGVPVLGGVYDPSRRELFLAERGRGATLDGRRLRVSATPRLKDALLITGFPIYGRVESLDRHLARFKDFLSLCHGVRRSGSAAIDLAWVAAGRADGFWESGLSPWDVAAGWLLVSEAGGRVSDFAGKPWRAGPELGRQTVASNGRVHAGMLKVLRGTR
ncbi:MAG: inositol monophosphatase family protein [Elusimicrobiota bacterium]|nr:inositol monophosphatase family protein [Elusimicrobiota bacterium]